MRTNGDVEVPLSEPPSSERDTPFMYVPRGTTLARTYTHTLATSRSAAVEQGGGERKTHVLIDPFWGGGALLSHGKVLARTFEMGQVRGITPGRGNPLTSAVVVKPWAPSRVVGSRCLLRHAVARQSLLALVRRGD
ncbi:hypothetical protein MTO96_029638 [Rhipicephalus appendiculatus]